MNNHNVIYAHSTNIDGCFGLLQHYYLSIPSKRIELHAGDYEKGNVYPCNNKDSSNVYKILHVCEECQNKLIEKVKSSTHFVLYPLVNCETLIRVFSGEIPVSFQSIIIIILFCSIVNGLLFSTWWFICSVVILLILILNNQLYYSTQILYCKHLNQHECIVRRTSD